MADTKISGMTAAGALTGAEQIECVQAGNTRRASVDQIATRVITQVPAGSAGAASLAQSGFAFAIANQPGSIWDFFHMNSLPDQAGDGGVGTTWEHNPADAVLPYLSALQYRRNRSAASVNSYAGFSNAQHQIEVYRKISGGPGGGFEMGFVCGFTSSVATRRLFIGATPYNDTTALINAADPTTRPNIIGLLKNSADANLSVGWTSNASVATKVDTGVGLAVLVNKALRVVLTVDRGGDTGNVTVVDCAVGTTLIDKDFTFDGNAPALDTNFTLLAGMNSGPSDATQYYFGLHKFVVGSTT